MAERSAVLAPFPMLEAACATLSRLTLRERPFRHRHKLSVMTTIRDSGGTGVVSSKEDGHEAKPFHILIARAPGC